MALGCLMGILAHGNLGGTLEILVMEILVTGTERLSSSHLLLRWNPVFVLHRDENRHDAEYQKHACCRVLPVPGLRLPHQEPLSTHGEEGGEPLENCLGDRHRNTPTGFNVQSGKPGSPGEAEFL